jgi:2-oxoisovalerate dehydrogenase E1 component beta subunit
MAELTLVQAVNQALHQEMARDPRVVVVGEDSARGGMFGATAGLFERFGEARVVDAFADDATTLGVAVGMAIDGLRPVAELLLADFAYGALDPLINDAAMLRYRTGGQFSCPLVLRAPYGGGVQGGPFQSQSPEAHFCHASGLKVVVPATAEDAKGLLLAAIQDDDPVVVLEPKRLYRQARGPAGGDAPVPIGQARVACAGRDVTLAAWGAMVEVALQAAEQARLSGVEVEVLDLRTLVPLDQEAFLASVRKTGRLVIVQEAPLTGGFAGEVAALAAEHAIEYLEAPILRVGGPDAPVPYALEHAYLPDVARVVRAIESAVDF